MSWHSSYRYLSFCSSSKTSRIIKLVLSFGCIAAVAALPSIAEETQPVEMLVQGVPYTQPLHDAPQSATIFIERELKERGDTSFQDIIERVPSLSLSGGTNRPRFFLIRGIGELEQYEGAPNPSVATIVDDVDLSGLGVAVPLFDINQVEVLRGPQATRFGASALAGAINVRTREPSAYTSGHVMLGAGNDDYAAGGFAVGGPIGGDDGPVQIRVTAFNSRRDGFRDNLFLGKDDTNERNESLARLKLRYSASPTLLFKLAGWMSGSANGYDAFVIDNGLRTESDRPGRDTMHAKAITLGTESKISDYWQLVNNFSAATAVQKYSFDGDWGNNPFWGEFAPIDYFSDSDRDRTIIADEVRILSNDSAYAHGVTNRYLAGGFFQRLAEDTRTAEFSNNEEFDSLGSNYHARTYALFGQSELALKQGSSLTMGLRVENRSTNYSDSGDAHFSPNYTMLGGAISYAYDVNDLLRAYALLARGFKGGGFNAGPSVSAERRKYEPEYLWNGEVGLKGAWLEKSLETNIALFHERRRDAQLKLALQDNPEDPLSFTYVTESSAKGQSTGIEIESTAHLSKIWDAFVSTSLMRAEYTAVPQELSTLDRREFSHAPNWQYIAGSRVALFQNFFVRGEVEGKDSFYFDDSHNKKSDSYSLVNLSTGWSDTSWSVVGWARNVFNETYAVRGFFFGNEPPDFPNKRYIQRGDPRTFGVTVEYRF